MLMMDERRREHFLGQLQELGAECAGHDRREFDQIRNFLEQRHGLRQLLEQRAAADAPRLRLEVAHDPIAAIDPREHHEVLGELLAVLVETADLDGAARPAARGEKPMPVGHRARRHVLDARTRRERLARDRERHDAAAVEKEQPANRPPEHELTFAVVELRVPVHLLREDEIAEHATEHFGEHVNGGAAAHVLGVRQVFSARRVHLNQRVEIRTELAREAEAGVGGVALGVEGRRHGRPHRRVVTIFLSIDQFRDDHREAARRRMRLDGRLHREADFRQAFAETGRERFGDRGQPRRRHLLDANFQEQFTIH